MKTKRISITKLINRVNLIGLILFIIYVLFLLFPVLVKAESVKDEINSSYFKWVYLDLGIIFILFLVGDYLLKPYKRDPGVSYLSGNNYDKNYEDTRDFCVYTGIASGICLLAFTLLLGFIFIPGIIIGTIIILALIFALSES